MNELQLLGSCAIFAPCSEDRLARVAELARRRRHAAGEVLFSDGDEARELLVIASGEVSLELPVVVLGEAKAIAFQPQHPGDIVGWSALVAPYRTTLGARVSKAAEVLALPGEPLRELLVSNPELGVEVMGALASVIGERLRHTKWMWGREIQRSLDERYR